MGITRTQQRQDLFFAFRLCSVSSVRDTSTTSTPCTPRCIEPSAWHWCCNVPWPARAATSIGHTYGDGNANSAQVVLGVVEDTWITHPGWPVTNAGIRCAQSNASTVIRKKEGAAIHEVRVIRMCSMQAREKQRETERDSEATAYQLSVEDP